MEKVSLHHYANRVEGAFRLVFILISADGNVKWLIPVMTAQFLWKSRKGSPEPAGKGFSCRKTKSGMGGRWHREPLFVQKPYLSPLLDIRNEEIISYAVSERADFEQIAVPTGGNDNSNLINGMFFFLLPNLWPHGSIAVKRKEKTKLPFYKFPVCDDYFLHHAIQFHHISSFFISVLRIK